MDGVLRAMALTAAACIVIIAVFTLRVNEGHKMNLFGLFNKKTTHLIAAATIILGILQGLGVFSIPTEIWAILGGLGMTRMRSGVEKIAKEVAEQKK